MDSALTVFLGLLPGSVELEVLGLDLDVVGSSRAKDGCDSVCLWWFWLGSGGSGCSGLGSQALPPGLDSLQDDGPHLAHGPRHEVAESV